MDELDITDLDANSTADLATELAAGPPYTDEQLRAVLESVSKIAVVGASANQEKAAHRIPAILQQAGFDMIPVNPSVHELLGQVCYPTLAEIPQDIDLVDVFRPSAEAADIARQAVEIGAKVLWLQLGITSPEARQIAEDAGLLYLEDVCTGAFVHRTGFRTS